MNKNVNRDYLVKVNVKTAEIETPKDDMIFYVTDIWTSNIFFQLDFGKGNSLTDLHKENASDYDLTLRVVKPNKEHKEIKASLLSQDSNFFVADLKPDFTDYIGICKCELFIETTINGRKETNTTDPFEYIVEGSVFSPLDEVIEGRPDYPPLADKLATKEYVDAAIANVNVPEADLSAYAPKESPVFTGSISMGRKSGSTVGINSFAVGNSTTASGNCSYAEGDNAKAIGHGSHVEGSGTIASSNYQHVQGLFNIEDTENKYSHIIGNGTPYARRNIHTLDWSGNAWFSGDVYVGGTSQDNANKVLSTADIKFTSDGKLSVTINGVTKTFNPA